VSAFGKTKTAAERALLKKLQDRARTNQSGDLTAMHKINYLLDLWETKFEEMVADGTRSPPPWTPTDEASRTTSGQLERSSWPPRGLGESRTVWSGRMLRFIASSAWSRSTQEECRRLLVD
jgi:hypothetical protein